MEDEKKLVDLVLKGDKGAARRLYGLVEKRVGVFFEAKTQTWEDAEELVQDTFLHFLDALPLFRFQSSLITFVMGIARHELMDYWRKKYAKRVIKVVSGQWLSDSEQWGVEQRGDVSKKMNLALEAAYQQLKPIQAKLLRWKYEEGKSVKEIAVLLGWSIKAVEAQLYRSRKAFQRVYIPIEEYF
jgi:RNA polymerase sigma-70 factor (ECF subfamily)